MNLYHLLFSYVFILCSYILCCLKTLFPMCVDDEHALGLRRQANLGVRPCMPTSPGLSPAELLGALSSAMGADGSPGSTLRTCETTRSLDRSRGGGMSRIHTACFPQLRGARLPSRIGTCQFAQRVYCATSSAGLQPRVRRKLLLQVRLDLVLDGHPCEPLRCRAEPTALCGSG